MLHLQLVDTLATIIQNFIYALGSLQFSDDDQDLAADIDTVLKAVQKLQLQTLQLDNENLRLTAGQRRKLRKTREVADELFSSDDAFRKSPAGKGKKSLFEQTIPQLFNVLTVADRDVALDTLKGKVAAGVPEPLKAAGKRFLAVMGELQAVRDQLAANDRKIATLASEVADVKTAAITAEVRLEGKLLDRHAASPDEVELAFRPAPVRKTKKSGESKPDGTKPAETATVPVEGPTPQP